MGLLLLEEIRLLRLRSVKQGQDIIDEEEDKVLSIKEELTFFI